MRKYGLLAVAAGLALSGSVARADFVVSSTRVANANGTDSISFAVQNTNGGTTTGLPFLQELSAAIYAPTSFNGTSYPGNGLYIISDDSHSPDFASGVPYVGPLSADSHFTNPVVGTNQLTNLQSIPSILNLDGTVDNSASRIYTDGQQVAGIGYSIGTTSAGINDVTNPVVFAVAVVPHGDPVELLQTTLTADAPGTRVFAPSFQATGTEFGAHDTSSTDGTTPLFLQADNNVLPFSDPPAVPEPASLGLVGLAMGGLLSRRRRSA